MKNVLVRPLVTEKITELGELNNQYGFVVDYSANKIEIAKSVKVKFDVDVVSVNTIRFKGKKKTQATKKGRFVGRTPKYKKAIVSIKDGQTIDLFGEV